MKRIKNLLLVIPALLLLFSCENRKASETFHVVKQYYGTYGVVYYLDIKNITERTLNGSFEVKVKCKDGTSKTNICFVNNMEPGEIQTVSIYNNSRETYNVDSWSYVE